MRVGFILAATLTLASATVNAEMPKDQARWGNAAKARAINNLKDPYSARFKNLYVGAWVAKPGEIYPFLCGEVNAKNSYGGYIGYQRFYSPGDGEIVFENDYPTVFADLWDERCGWKIKPLK